MGVEGAIIGGSLLGGGLSFLGSREQSRAASNAANAQVMAAQIAAENQWRMYQQGREDIAPWREAGIEALEEQRRLLGPATEQSLREMGFRKESLENLQGSMGQLADLINKRPTTRDYQLDPYRRFMMQQGIEAINRGSSASGSLDSGARLKDLVSFGQGMSQQGYADYERRHQNRIGNLSNLANRYAANAGMIPLSQAPTTLSGGGQAAGQNLASLGQALGTNLANLNVGAGQARAGGYIGQANAATGLYGNLSNIGSNALNQYMMYNYLQNAGLQQPYWGQSNLNQIGY